MACAGLNAGIDPDGATARNSAYPARKCLPRERKPAILKSTVVKVHPDRTIKCYWIRSISIGDDLQREAVGVIKNTRWHRAFSCYNLSSSSNARAAPVIGAAVVNITAAVGESHDRIIAVHLRIITVRSALGNSIEQRAGDMQAAVRIPGNSGNHRLAGSQLCTVRRVNIQLTSAVS